MKNSYLFSTLIGLSLITFLSLPLAAQEENYFAGTLAGASNTTGSFNAFVGYKAGTSNSTGLRNAFVGTAAGYSNTTGNSNAFVGYRAGFANTTASNNTFLGSNAGLYNTSGSGNAFVGTAAGYNNDSGGLNAFMGIAAGYSNTSGNFNTFVGAAAGFSNTTASSNAFFGYETGSRTTTGQANAFVGYRAGYANTTANNNAFLGHEAGLRTTTGGNNTFLGFQAGLFNTSGYRNSFIGTNAGHNTTTGLQNTFTGYEAGAHNTTGNANTALGYAAGTSAGALTNATAIGYRAQVFTSNSLVLGSISGLNGAKATVKVGIGTASPDYRLHVNGTAAKPGSSVWIIASDKQLKKNIRDFTDGLQVLKQIHPVTYQYNGKAGLPTEKQYVGVIAQEMQKVAPYTVGTFTYQDSTAQVEKYLDYDATALTYILVNSVQQQQQEIDSLKNELRQIKQLLRQLASASPIPSTKVPTEAQLGQNQPNPYDQSTLIPYYLPETTISASLKFYTITGQEVHTVQLTKKGQGAIQLSNRQLAAGTYVYRLFVNGQSVASKKLVVAPL